MGKLIGFIMVFLGSSGISGYIVGGYAVRIRILEELEQALQFLCGEIEYAACDMAELMERLAQRGYYFSDFFTQLREKILLCDGQPLSAYWKQGKRAVRGYESLTAEDLELFEAIGANLGNLDRQTQLHTLSIFSGRLAETIAQARSEYRNKAKVCSVAGITAGLFLAIALL